MVIYFDQNFGHDLPLKRIIETVSGVRALDMRAEHPLVQVRFCSSRIRRALSDGSLGLSGKVIEAFVTFYEAALVSGLHGKCLSSTWAKTGCTDFYKLAAIAWNNGREQGEWWASYARAATALLAHSQLNAGRRLN
ncbi:hypothetical protein G6L35_26205 [Agrobacterium tumefaciens]|uniref:hypothetical protein n=1 Tax=Agrobacterium tumefaciens TaxID=358 RepID=UPI00157358A8|nr:hypothetical protein [Agrobacterium tumefaciens]NSZ72095.1 hypothetical protein [Agrobacterium tumefaciens]